MNVYLKIGPLDIVVETPTDSRWTPEVEVFRVSGLPVDSKPFFYSLHFVEEFQPVWGKLLYAKPQLTIMDVDGQEARIHCLPGASDPFAMSQRIDDDRVRVWIDHRAQNALKWDRNLLGLLSLEHDMLRHNAFLLHASFIIHDGCAIVFTAPSGSGKSTQADLWAEHAGAEIVNGDRTLLYQQNGQWFAAGFPVCGSSQYCLNRTAPVKAVICLAKAPENEALHLSGMQGMKLLYSQAFVNRWNSADCKSISDMVIDLTNTVQVIHYRCTKEPDAVPFLKDVIFSTDLKG